MTALNLPKIGRALFGSQQNGPLLATGARLLWAGDFGGHSSRRNLSVSSRLQSDRILVNVDGKGVRRVVFNRPEAKNAMSYDMFAQLGKALSDANTDAATKLIVLTGKGDFFSSGNDLNNWGDTTSNSTLEMKEKTRKNVLGSFMYGFIDCKKPIIALVNGPGIGAGATLLAFCDQVIASDKAWFVTPFPQLGIVPEFCSSYTFPKIMGYAKAADMLMFGHKLTAQEALQCGFVSKVLPSASFEEECQKFVDQYSQIPYEPLLRAKELIRAPEREKLRKLCTYEMSLVVEAVDCPIVQEKMKAFLESKKKK